MVASLEVSPRQAIEQLQAELGLSRNELAQTLAANPRTVERWHAGETYPQHEMRRKLAELVGLQHRLRDTFSSPEAGRSWLRSPNRYLGGLAPLDALRAGRLDRVEAALDALDSGVFV